MIQIIKPIAIRISSAADGIAGLIIRRGAGELEAVAAVEAGEVQIGGKAAGLAKNDIARPGVGAIGIGATRTDDYIIETVAIDIAPALTEMTE
jgi:hypothetical protein